jgi:RNA polymerase sigma-70 factor (ECF subfamily)
METDRAPGAGSPAGVAAEAGAAAEAGVGAAAGVTAGAGIAAGAGVTDEAGVADEAGAAVTAEAAIAAPEGPRLGKPGFAEEALPWLDAVYRFALRLTAGNGEEADDIVQETFLRAYRSWHTYERGSSARAWLFTIARNVFLRARERQTRRPETLASELDYDIESVIVGDALRDVVGHDPEHRFFASFIDEEVSRAVEQLPEDFREVVVLSDIEGLGYAEIADIVGIPLGTVKSRLYRGRRLLQRALYEYAVEMGYTRRSTT